MCTSKLAQPRLVDGAKRHATHVVIWRHWCLRLAMVSDRIGVSNNRNNDNQLIDRQQLNQKSKMRVAGVPKFWGQNCDVSPEISVAVNDAHCTNWRKRARKKLNMLCTSTCGV